MWDLFTKADKVASWPLGLCSILALAIIMERLFTLYKLKQLEESAFETLRASLEKGEDYPKAAPGVAGAPITQVMDTLLVLRGATEDAVQQAAEIALSMQRLRLRRYLNTLATIGSTAPFIGLFGTVLGVMQAFQGMSKSGLSNEGMALGISSALSATALGLLVAIPSVMAYNFLLGRVQQAMLQIQGHVARLIPLLHTPVLRRKQEV
jgi:biopolymer transport protein ExbB